MKKNVIFIIFLILILIGNFFVSATNTNLNILNIKNFSDIEAELPVWSIGDYWIYDMHFDFALSGVVGIDGLDPNDPDKGLTNMKVEVTEIDEVNEEYVLNIQSDLEAELELFGIGIGTYIADVEGVAHIDIPSLAIKDFDISSLGEYQLLVSRTTTVDIKITFEPPFDFFNFPINSSEDSWNADTYAVIDGHINVDGLYDSDFGAEGAFENETISFVKTEEITVPGGTYDCFQISGLMGPSHGGWSKLWYSPNAKYLVKVDEKINNWEGVDAQLDIELQATNCNVYSLLDVMIHRIKMIDDIEILPEWPGADWSYKLSVDDGENWIYEINNDYSNDEDDHTEDFNYQIDIFTTTPRIILKVWDRDFWSGDDLADVSSQIGGGIDNEIPDLEQAMFKCKYDIVDNKLIDNDTVVLDNGFFLTSGDFLPDGSASSDENDAKIWFKITDDYEPPQKPNKPTGPINGKPGEEYTYSVSAASPNENQRFYKWDWGDNTESKWLGPFNADETIKASHIWGKQETFQIKVKVKDVYDVESDWSDPLNVKIPRKRETRIFSFIKLFKDFYWLLKIFENINYVIKNL